MGGPDGGTIRRRRDRRPACHGDSGVLWGDAGGAYRVPAGRRAVAPIFGPWVAWIGRNGIAPPGAGGGNSVAPRLGRSARVLLGSTLIRGRSRTGGSTRSTSGTTTRQPAVQPVGGRRYADPGADPRADRRLHLRLWRFYRVQHSPHARARRRDLPAHQHRHADGGLRDVAIICGYRGWPRRLGRRTISSSSASQRDHARPFLLSRGRRPSFRHRVDLCSSADSGNVLCLVPRDA